MASEVVVVMVPFVAQGHLNQLLHLSGLLSSYNLPIHFLCSATNTRQARHRLHGWNPNNLIHFHQLPDPEFTSPPPDPNSTTQFPTHLQPSFNSSLHLRRPVADIIRSLSHTATRVAVVHDSLMSYVVQDVKSIPNAETYIFRALSIFYVFCFQWEKLGRKLPFETHLLHRLPMSAESMTQEFMEFIKLQYSHQTIHVGNLYDSSRVIEGKFLELLEKDSINGKNHWAVGPFNPVDIQSEISDSCRRRHNCLQWLDKQPEKSVVFVSFGTTTTFTEEQIGELAVGLENSDQRFLWVLRDADKGDVFMNDGGRRVVLPEGFEERVAERGLVVRDWAPQLEILGHRSTGGFVSHCGWNSSMEAMTAGVAIAAWPLHSDQPRNAFLMADVLGVALMMKDWSCRDELFTSVMVEKVIRKLMDSEEGEAIRQRAAELGGELRRSMAEGGVTLLKQHAFVT
ncbi:UDP-glucuronosyl/UDP-glucosyltransferase [Cynara cardunculus var. scolymus]|uniref:UDP-glucuronosyl/UDP-glucosyltransferase n=1 Tax=Cynara cardunculus var. scolymus TaxID=59895 RepID=A0A103XQD6_CYNCS|nr:UDP-glucuronosyl/UDP-glucosyltransferase [Cynara cardunculus var. scolymus]